MADNPKLIAVLHEIAAEQNLQNYEIKVTPVSSGGANYTSHLYAIVISTKERNLHLFVKVAALGENMREAFMVNIYKIEKYICTELSADFKQIEDKHGLKEEHRFKIPKYYGGSTKKMEEIAVFEDLSHRGFKTYDRMKSITWAYGSAVCTEMAKLHALSMVYERENPEHYKKTMDFLKFDFINMNPEGMTNAWEKCKESSLKIVRKENRDRFDEFLEGKDVIAFVKFCEPKKREVLMHGDFRISNIMHRDREDGSVEVIPVDYQTMRDGCAIVDLYYFIFTGTDAEFRNQYYDKLIAHYYSELRAALARLGVDPDEIYTKEDYEFELKELLPFGLAVSVFCLPIVTVDPENAPKVDENMDMNTFDFSKTGDLFSTRLNELIDDFIKWGVL